ncbi:MAG: cyclohexanecarboxylate-CoA ligase [Actinomycetota bacterium]|nr:cyclohexanecarboxylate-CoA ligase [Actinomycetota bacterium]
MLVPTFASPLASHYRRPGGPWDIPSLDALLTRVTGMSLADRVARVAGGLRASGVEAGDAVAWQSANRDEIAVLYRACWRIGAVAAPVHHLMGPSDVAGVLDAVQPVFVVEDLDALPSGDPVEEPWTDASSLAAVLFTSGSSGTPKGVLHTQATLGFKAVQMRTAHGLGPDDCVLMPAPGAHISGLLNGVTLPGVVPFPTVFMARWDPEAALALIERERVTFMVGPPTFFVSMMQAPGFSRERVASLRLISSGGAGVGDAFVAEAADAFGARVKRTYGSTEVPTIITDGHTIGEVEVRVDDNGELLARGPEVCVGYLGAEQTAEAFTAEGWFRTGDLAAIDGTGAIEIVGRLKDVIIRGGENISTAEVENVLEAHPGVRHAVAVGAADPVMGERVVAFVEGAADFDLAACRAWFVERGIAKYKTPERVIVVDALPLLPTGKPDRTALRARLTTRE